MEENKTQPSSPGEAVKYIISYFNFLGIDQADIDFTKRPKGLPDDVNKAWDILEEDQDEYEEIYGVTDDKSE